MIRVHVICEGQTEELFVNELLSPAFWPKGIQLVPSLVGKPGHKGGNFKFERLQTDVRNRLLSDRTSYCTTFFDYYGLPESFPGKAASNALTVPEQKAGAVQQAMTDRLQVNLGGDAMRRFVPFVQMYEFEALLFSDPQAFATGIDRLELVDRLEKISSSFDSPEHINDSPQTAPSKRIEQLIPGYEKPLVGALAAKAIGLEKMRAECLLFDAWLESLERLANQAG